jgi:predicted secreted protein
MAMPIDARGRRVVVVCHCLVNANSKVEGLSQYQGVHPLVQRLAEKGVGIIQMRCAEMTAMGMRRWGQTYEQYDNAPFRAHCEALAEQTLADVTEYLRTGYEVLGVVGVDGSPTCGVNKSAHGEWGGEHAPAEWAEAIGDVGSESGPGVHIETLRERLEPLGVRFTAIDESVEGHEVDRVLADLGLTDD